MVCSLPYLLETSARRGGVRCLLCETWAPSTASLCLRRDRLPEPAAEEESLPKALLAIVRLTYGYLLIVKDIGPKEGVLYLKKVSYHLQRKKFRWGGKKEDRGDFTLLFSINLSTRVIACSKERDQKEKGDLWKAWDSKACRERLKWEKKRQNAEYRLPEQPEQLPNAPGSCSVLLLSFCLCGNLPVQTSDVKKLNTRVADGNSSI